MSDYIQVQCKGVKNDNEESLCPKCFASKDSGQEHTCTSKRKYVTNLQQSLPQKVQEQLSSKVIKEKAHACGSKTAQLCTHGKPIHVSIGTTSDKKAFTHEDIISIKRDMGLSDRKTYKMAKHFRDKCGIRWALNFTLIALGGMYV